MELSIHHKISKVVVVFMKYVSLLFAALIAIVPLIVVFLGSFKTKEEFSTTKVLELPHNFLNFDNYIRAFVEGKMLLGFANTLFILFFSILATLLTGTMTAYILSRFDFKLKKLVQAAFLIASLIPSITMQMSTFQIISRLGIFNTRISTIILFAGTDIISIYIFLQFLNNISRSLDESAIMDGASYLTIFFRILIPLMKPAIVTVLIIKGVNFYNEFYTPFLYMPSTDLAVISTALFKFKGPYGTQWEVICAGVIITIIPTLLIFLLLQKQIYSGLTQGSVKE